MTDLVPIFKGKSTQVSLAELQDRLDARKLVEETRTTTSTRKARVEDARRKFEANSVETLLEIQTRAEALAQAFDGEIGLKSIPLSQVQVNTLSREFYELEKLKVHIEALETRYRELVFAHLDEVAPKIPGRPAAQIPGKLEATGPEPHYIFERRGGNRSDPTLDIESLRSVLPEEVAADLFLTVNHPAVPARTEEVFNVELFGRLVDAGIIDLDVVAAHLTPGKWRTPSFYKTLVDGGER